MFVSCSRISSQSSAPRPARKCWLLEKADYQNWHFLAGSLPTVPPRSSLIQQTWSPDPHHLHLVDAVTTRCVHGLHLQAPHPATRRKKLKWLAIASSTTITAASMDVVERRTRICTAYDSQHKVTQSRAEQSRTHSSQQPATCSA